MNMLNREMEDIKKAQIQIHKNKYNRMEMYEMNSMLGSTEARIREFVGLEI